MRKVFLGSLLILSLVLVLGGAALAMPMTGSDPGAISVFVEYGNDGDYWESYTGYTLGVSYAFSENFSLAGARYTASDGDGDDYTGYLVAADLRFDRILIQANLFHEIDYSDYVKLSGAYLFELGSSALGVGAFYFNEFEYDETGYGLEVRGSFPISESLTIYGSCDYFLDSDNDGDFTYRAGCAYGF